MRKGFTLIELMIVIAIIAIIAAIAIPNLLESRITSNESAAATSLKSGIHPAQAQFQGGNYADEVTLTATPYVNSWANAPTGTGGNGIGDFAGTFNQMCGGVVTTGGTPAAGGVSLSLLPPTWGSASGGAGGVIPGGAAYTAVTGGTLAGPNVNNYIFLLAAQNESGFSVTCAPSDGLQSIGRRRFGISAAGTVYSTPAAATNAEVAPTAATAPFGGGNPIVAGVAPWNAPSGATAAGAGGPWVVHKK